MIHLLYEKSKIVKHFVIIYLIFLECNSFKPKVRGSNSGSRASAAHRRKNNSDGLSIRNMFRSEKEGTMGCLFQSFKWWFLIRWLYILGDFSKFWSVGLLSVQTFQPLICIYSRGNFMYHHWGCTSNYRPLSYPFISLILKF